MQVTVESTGKLERKMRVELPAERIEKEVESRLKRVGQTARIKGFRPGKVPPNVVRQHYGSQVRQEVLSELMGQSYRDAVQQENLNPAAHPRIEPELGGKSGSFAFTATFEVLPEVKLKGLDKVTVTVPEVDITDTDCDEMIGNLRRQKATWVEAGRASAEGDRVIVDFEGTLKGEAFKGGTGKEVPVILGEGQMLPDFEKALYGVQAGEDKSFKVQFPKDYHSDELAGQKVDFRIAVQRVEERELPPLDDTLAGMYGVEDGGLERLKSDVRQNMRREADQRIRADIREQALSGLLDANPVEVPKSLVHQEAHSMQHEVMHQYGIEDHDKAPPIDNFLESAEKRVRLSFLIRQLIEDNGLEADPEKVKSRVEELCAGYENAEEMVRTYLANRQIMERIEPMVLEEQAVDWIVRNGKEKVKKIAFREYMKPPGEKAG
ncbi:MAG: trigger factor [Gammaproteobacteria bacterium]|nr:trigger factor [Gammaproteobacteria bacterium]MDH5346012.1 trigger factor [Gammaproteobacteria bacterium]